MEKDMQNKFIANRIKQLASDHNITISKLAKSAGINKSTINNIMNSGIVPTISTVFSICSALNMTLPEFFDFYPYNKKEASSEAPIK
ncbi:helix-turn-helix domain-containing protein [Enterococcus casseliflavus]|uniref:helix-turn-helix domain-containing protein n=1 Tax=Enterococcus casseliflavus TaxID=37734 RepID=UPI002DC004D4|nr:helix-turn-helix transcriptional regulator [Enterococcus casseliflavus]MEB8399493.1 helix-turn-helix domain-containing protein [Enterococcus casseliflavus]